MTGTNTIAQQQRAIPTDSRQIMDRVLRASADLITEHGVQHLSIRKIATRSQIDVPTIERFFPSKYAIIAALYEDWIRAAQNVFEQADKKLPTAEHWRPFFVEFLKAYEDVGFTASLEVQLIEAVTFFDDLRQLDQEYLDWATEKIASYIRHFSPICTHDCSMAMAVLVLEWDLALAHQEISYPATVHNHLLHMTWEGILHLLKVCIEDRASFAETGTSCCC